MWREQRIRNCGAPRSESTTTTSGRLDREGDNFQTSLALCVYFFTFYLWQVKMGFVYHSEMKLYLKINLCHTHEDGY